MGHASGWIYLFLLTRNWGTAFVYGTMEFELKWLLFYWDFLCWRKLYLTHINYLLILIVLTPFCVVVKFLNNATGYYVPHWFRDIGQLFSILQTLHKIMHKLQNLLKCPGFI